MKATNGNFFSTPVLYTLFMKIRPYTGGYAILFLSFGVLVWYALYSNSLIQSLRTNANMAARTYADLIRNEIANKSEFDSEIGVIEQVIAQYDIPVIITDTYWRPLLWSNITVGGLFGRTRILSTEISPRVVEQLEDEIRSFRKYYDPRHCMDPMVIPKLAI